MTIEARQALVDSPKTVFQSDRQRSDLLNPALTRTELIAFLTDLVTRGHIIEFTALSSDHHNDRDLNPMPPYSGTHGGGFAADCWPLASTTAGDYLDPSDPRFRAFLVDAAKAPYYFQTGLAGTAFSGANMMAAGDEAFQDSGADHVHLGCRETP